MLNGHMLCGVEVGRFMFRVGKDHEAKAWSRPGASPMDLLEIALAPVLFGGGRRLFENLRETAANDPHNHGPPFVTRVCHMDYADWSDDAQSRAYCSNRLGSRPVTWWMSLVTRLAFCSR